MPVSLDLDWSVFQRLPDSSPPFPLQESKPCPLCETDSGDELIHLKRFQCFEDRAGQNRIEHRVLFCNACGMIYTSPWFTKKGARYLLEHAGASYGHCDPAERVDWILSNVASVQSVLDLGCGEGTLLNGFPQSFDLAGVEADSQLLKSGQQKFPHLKFIQSDLDNLDVLPEVELVTMFHILEHLSDPVRFLKELRAQVRPKTQLVIEVPILDRAIETSGPDICGFFSIPHRSHFSRRTLAKLLSQTGWEIELSYDLAGNGYRVLVSQAEMNTVSVQTDIAVEKKLAMAYVQHRQSSISSIKKVLSNLPESGNFLIWGGGHHTEFLVGLTSLLSQNRHFLIVDNDPQKSGLSFHGIPVVEPGAITPEQWQATDFTVVISSYNWQEPIARELTGYGVEASRIIRLYPHLI